MRNVSRNNKTHKVIATNKRERDRQTDRQTDRERERDF